MHPELPGCPNVLSVGLCWLSCQRLLNFPLIPHGQKLSRAELVYCKAHRKAHGWLNIHRVTCPKGHGSESEF